MKTLISKIRIAVDIFVVVLLLMIAYFVFNLKLLYTMIASSWTPPEVLNPKYSIEASNVTTNKVKQEFNSYEYYYYVMEPKKLKDQKTIVWFTGQYFLSTYVNERYFQLICEKTERRLIVFEYPTIKQGKLDEIIKYIGQLLPKIFKSYNVKSIIIGGDNSGCFYALIYADFVKNMYRRSDNITDVNIEITEIVFIDGIYNVSSLPLKFYRALIGAATTDFSKNYDARLQTTYQHLTQVETRVIRVETNIMSSKDEFHAAINKAYVNQDPAHRILYEIDGKKFFYFLENNLELVSKWFLD